MAKKVSNPPPPIGIKKPPAPPPPPPCRTVGFFGETKESIKARRDYEMYMKGWRDGFKSSV